MLDIFNIPVSQTSMNPFSTPGMKFLGIFIPTVSSENSRDINLSPVNGCRIIKLITSYLYFQDPTIQLYGICMVHKIRKN